MARFLKKRKETIGKSPGSMVFIGQRKMESVRIRMIDYNQDSVTEKQLNRIIEESACIERDTVSWINIDGLHDVDAIRDAGNVFNLHPLLLDDIVNTGKRPKFEEYDEYLFVVLKMLQYDIEKNHVISEQLSIVIGNNFLLTFQEQPGDVFEPVRDRIRNKRKRIRNAGPDYLAYALIDTVVDNYIHIMEQIGDQIEDIEELVMGEPEIETIETITNFKRELNYLRKAVRPAREVVFQLSRTENELLRDDTLPFMKDLLDHATEAKEAIEFYREMLSDFLNLYNTTVGNRMNDIMKVLTIFAAIFIPLTFIAGIYGTNFEYVPELKFKYSYFIFWGVLVVVGISMLAYFKRKKWF